MEYKVEKFRKRKLLLEKLSLSKKELGENEYNLTIKIDGDVERFVVEVESFSFLRKEPKHMFHESCYSSMHMRVPENKYEARLQIINASFEISCRMSEILVDIYRNRDYQNPINLIFENSTRRIFLLGASTKSFTSNLAFIGLPESLIDLDIELF